MSNAYPLIPLSNVLSVPLANGRSVPTAETGFPVLRLTALGDNGVDVSEHKIGRWTKDEATPYFINQGDLLIARGNGSLAKVGRGSLVRQNPPEVAFPDTIIRARVRPERILPEFLALAWNSPTIRQQIESQARTTAGIYKINQTHLKNILIPAPPLDQQLRIIAEAEYYLTKVDATIASIKVNKSRLEVLRQQLVLGVVTGKASAEPRKPWELTELGLHDGDLPDIPASWMPARLGDIADVVGGVTKDAKKQSDPDYVSRPYLRVANVQRGHLDLGNITEIKVSEKKAAQLELQHGDLLLNEGGDRDKLARGWVWEGQVPQCIHQNHVFRARIRNNIIDPYFLSLLANTVGGRWAERNGKQSVNLASISLSKIKQMPVVVPPLAESQRLARQILSQLANLDRLDQALGSTLRQANGLRQSVLSAALQGRLTESQVPAVALPDGHSPDTVTLIAEASLT